MQTTKTLEKTKEKGRPALAEEDKKGGKTVSAHVDADLLKQIEAVRYSRERKAGSIIAEAIKLGLPLVEERFPATRVLPEGWEGEALPK